LAVSAAFVGCGRQSEPSPSQSAPPASPSPAAGDVTAAGQVDSVMTLWRTAIQDHDADSVQSCDQLFRNHPASFTPALIASARNDSNDRVRAFSTRVLGKRQDPALAPVFRELLADSSKYVRGNAAWALGQLPGAGAVSDLQGLQKTDPAPEVRKATTEAALERASAGRPRAAR
jgi:hypothetical protein